MGSGKTAVSAALSKKLKCRLVDTDALVEKKAGIRIKKIFELWGEEKFRALESAAAKKAAALKGAVIATGGGIIKKKRNIAALSGSGVIVYLKNSFAVSQKRLKGKKDRPLFDHENLKAARALFRKRQKLYAAAADITVVTDRKNVRQVVNEIIRRTRGGADAQMRG